MVSPTAINEMQSVDVTNMSNKSDKQIKMQLNKLAADDAWVSGRPHADSGCSFEDLGNDYEEIKK